MAGYLTNWVNENFHWPPPLHEFHTNRHPSLAKSGRRTRRFHQQTASWNLNDTDMNELSVTNCKWRVTCSPNFWTLCLHPAKFCYFWLPVLTEANMWQLVGTARPSCSLKWSKLPEFPQIIQAYYIEWNEVATSVAPSTKSHSNVNSAPGREHNTLHTDLLSQYRMDATYNKAQQQAP